MRSRGSADVAPGISGERQPVLPPQRVAVGAEADLTHDDREAEAVLGAAVFDEGELIGPHDLDLPGKAGLRLARRSRSRTLSVDSPSRVGGKVGSRSSARCQCSTP